MKKTLVVFILILFLSGCDFVFYSDSQTTASSTTTTLLSTTITDSIDLTTTTVSETTTLEVTTLEDLSWTIDTTNTHQVYEWIKLMQLPNGLHTSTEDTEILMLSLYDNALAALVYIMYEDYDRVELMFDFFESKRETILNDEYGGFPQFMDVEGNIYGGGIGLRWLGDNAWLLVAINQYHYQTQSNTYQDLANDLDTWIRSLQNEDGSLSSGLNYAGEMMGPVTEAMIDSYNAVLGFDQFHVDLLTFFETERYDFENKILVTLMDDFYIDYRYAIDMSSWAYLAMNGMPVKVLDFAESRFSMTENEVFGYCIDEDKDAIWPEHTLQMAVAYVFAGHEYYDRAQNIILNMEKLFVQSEIIIGLFGLPYATNKATMFGADSLWEGVDENIYMSSCAWYLFAKYGFNPFESGRYNKEPESVLDRIFYTE